jgi:multiple sugar transport system permease protein
MKRDKRPAIAALVLSVISAVFIFPVYWFLTTSLKNPKDIWVSPLKWVFTPTLMNYADVAQSVLLPFLNSVSITASALAVAFCFGLPCAYALGRFALKKKESIAFNFLSQFMLPPMALIVAFYIFFNSLGLVGSRLALILCYVSFDLPLVVWLMRDYFEGLPKEIDEAALVDGCSPFGSFFRVSLPLVKPGLTVTAIMCFIFTWNEYFYAVILTNRKTQTLPLLLGLYYRQYDVAWGSIAALGIFTITPVVVFGILMQRRLVRGLTLGAVKA